MWDRDSPMMGENFGVLGNKTLETLFQGFCETFVNTPPIHFH